jgi:hypothetical protein
MGGAYLHSPNTPSWRGAQLGGAQGQLYLHFAHGYSLLFWWLLIYYFALILWNIFGIIIIIIIIIIIYSSFSPHGA